MNLVERVDAYGRQHDLWQPGRALVVACSGGPDSLALLDILNRLAPLYRLSLTACYVHHGIRRAADDEVALVRQEATVVLPGSMSTCRPWPGKKRLRKKP